MRATVFTVTDLKQMGYCPRIVYYAHCLPGLRIAGTHTMVLGTAANAATEALEHRRSLRAYGVRDGKREFDVWLESEALGLRGRLDMLIDTGDELIPVDYKDSANGFEAAGRRAGPPRPTREVQHNWAVQVAAYGMLVEAIRGRPVRRGFIYYIPARRAREVQMDSPLRSEVAALLAEMGQMVEGERHPEPTPVRSRCTACEYRRLCNDV